jgi:hypothetical protein
MLSRLPGFAVARCLPGIFATEASQYKLLQPAKQKKLNGKTRSRDVKRQLLQPRWLHSKQMQRHSSDCQAAPGIERRWN